MDEPQPRSRADVCHRCLEPVPPKASRCPRCGEPIHKSANIRMILAAFGLLMFVVVAAVAFRLMQTSSAPAPATVERPRMPGEPEKPPPPPKEPALGH